MKKARVFFVAACLMLGSLGCATMSGALPSGADRITQEFFEALQQSDTQAARNLFSQQLSGRITQERFDQYVEAIEAHWGKIESTETAVLPFHDRSAEEAFLPSDTTSVKKYTFEVKFQNASVYCDLTLAQEDEDYRIVWFSFWGSGNYSTPDIDQKAEELFS